MREAVSKEPSSDLTLKLASWGHPFAEYLGNTFYEATGSV